jgi:hypothetical protein
VNTYYQNPPGNVGFPFSAIWLGSIDARTAGVYKLSLNSTGPATIFVDGIPVLSDGPAGGSVFGSLSLTAKAHRIRIEYRAVGGYLHCYLQWQPPGQASYEPIPPSVTEPAHQ